VAIIPAYQKLDLLSSRVIVVVSRGLRERDNRAESHFNPSEREGERERAI